MCILDSQGVICGVLPRGVPRDTPSEAVYDFIAISGILIGSRVRRRNSLDSDSDVDALFSSPTSNTEGNTVEDGRVMKKGRDKGKNDGNADLKDEPRLFRYNVLLIRRNGGTAYHRVALGLILSDTWERENTGLAYFQLE